MISMNRKKIAFYALAAALAVFWAAPFGSAQEQLSQGQTLYVPVYSHIYSGDKERPVYLAVTVSIRNIDSSHAITLTAVDYYDTEGKRIKQYLESPRTLAPMASTRFIVKESDKTGGSGANFLIQWHSDTPVNPLLAESIMISTASQLGISFNARGVPIIENKP